MNAIELPGCRADVLGGYLQALGLLRAVATQVDPEARLSWTGDRAVLHTGLTGDGLLDWLTRSYTPAPIVSPWNSGSGFAGNGKSRSAEEALAAVRDGREARFGPLQAAIRVAEEVVAEGRRRGWGGGKGELWAKEHKIDVVRLCRARLPDDALPWLDVAVTLTLDDLAFNALTGTGGNFGRQELAATYYARLLTLMGPKATVARSREWAESALFGREDVPYERDTVGQYDPGRAGGIHAAADEKGDGQANPWSFVLVMEGTLLFASAAVRRNAAARAAEAKPFFTYATPVGHGSAAENESTKGEQWVPLWEHPAGLAEIAHLMGEGRAQWRGRQASSGLEFALAVASLGVDRGLTGFRRFIIAERLGQNPLAVSAGYVPRISRPEERLLREPYAWIERLGRLSLPNGVAAVLRRVERQMFAVAAGGGRPALAGFVVEFGRLHEAVGRSGNLRGQIAPYQTRRGDDWPAALAGEDELWLAAGFASLHDRGGPGRRPIRELLTRCSRNAKGGYAWADQTGTGIDLYGATLIRTLSEAHRLRVISAGAVGDEDDATLRGRSAAYDDGLWLPVHLVERFVRREVSDDLIADYLRGLLVLGCSATTKAARPAAPPHLPDPGLALLLPFFGPQELTVLRRDRRTGEKSPHTVRLAPRPDWLPKLAARGVPAVADDVRLRLRLAGLDPSPARPAPRRGGGDRLAAALLLPVSPRARERALTRTCAVETAQRIADPLTPVEEGAFA